MRRIVRFSVLVLIAVVGFVSHTIYTYGQEPGVGTTTTAVRRKRWWPNGMP